MPLYSSSPWQEAGGGGGGMTDELEAVQAQIASLHRSTSGGGRGAVAEESRRSCRAPADAPALCAGGNSILADLGQTHTAGTTGSLLHRETNAIMVHMAACCIIACMPCMQAYAKLFPRRRGRGMPRVHGMIMTLAAAPGRGLHWHLDIAMTFLLLPAPGPS